MERQRSFSVKSTRLLVLSFTISSSLFFFTSFSIWVFRSTPLIPRETNLHFNKTTPIALTQHNPISVQTLTDFSVNFTSSRAKGPILVDFHFNESGNISGFAGSSGLEKSERNLSGSLEDGGSEKYSQGNEALESQKVHGMNITEAPLQIKALENPESLVFDGIKGERNVSSTLQDGAFEKTSEENDGLNVQGMNTTEASLEQIMLSENPDLSVLEDIKREPNNISTSQKSVTEEYAGRNWTLESQTAHGVNTTEVTLEQIEVSKSERFRLRDCDLEKGRWVYDETYPLYTNSSCPFVDEGFNCEGNGRPDKGYMRWRWQPEDCEIPRFNATNMLELIRGKRLVFVGDSINRNQWESMLCMLMGAVSDPKKVYETRGRKITKGKGNYAFKFEDYKCTVEFHVTHFLVHESKARVGKKRVPTLRIDNIDRASSKWRGADILVFNSAHWWSHHKTKAGINYYQEGNDVHPRLDASTAFRRALTTWSSWVDKYINPQKTQVFFRSSSPSHFSGGQWNSGGHCREATVPLNTTSSVLESSDKNLIAEDVIRNMKTPVTFLNITGLSGYRIDGHPSTYGRKLGNDRLSGIQDCSHWCLPGVPDIWNELLYLHLQMLRPSPK